MRDLFILCASGDSFTHTQMDAPPLELLYPVGRHHVAYPSVQVCQRVEGSFERMWGSFERRRGSFDRV